jgi:hypothetical protein
MTAVPIFVWNGSAWQETGPTIPASPIAYQASAPSSPSTGDIWVDSDGDVTTGSQQFQRFRFVASGGETTISGADADGAILAYTAGLEQVILNGAVLVRGQDYTATDGTNITGLSPALVANDVLEVFSFIAFTVANTYTQSQVDGLIAGANATSGSRLLIPGSAVNGTVSASGTVSFSGVTSVSINDVFSSTYDNYMIKLNNCTSSGNTFLNLRFRVLGADESASQYFGQQLFAGGTTVSGFRSSSQTSWLEVARLETTYQNIGTINIYNPFATKVTTADQSIMTAAGSTGIDSAHWTRGLNTTTSYTGFTLIVVAGSTTISGSISVYGFNK